jgi:hypothetical protein
MGYSRAVLLLPLIVLMVMAGSCGIASGTTTTESTSTAKLTTAASTVTAALVPAASAAEVVARVTQGTAAAQSYRLDRNISAMKMGSSDGKSGRYDFSAWSNMVLDIAGLKMQMDNKFNVKPPPGQPDWPLLDNSIYVDEGTIYMRGLFPDEPDLWAKTPVSDTYWQQQNQAAHLIGLLDTPQAAVLAPEYIQNSGKPDIPCDVLAVTPDPEKLWALLLEQPGIATMELPAQAPAGVDFSQMVKSAEMKLWVAQGSGFIMKAVLQMSVQAGPALRATLSNDTFVEVSASMIFYDYDQAPVIELPQAAKEAVELKLQSGTATSKPSAGNT